MGEGDGGREKAGRKSARRAAKVNDLGQKGAGIGAESVTFWALRNLSGGIILSGKYLPSPARALWAEAGGWLPAAC